MFRECLRNNITPFIISTERREEYINGLKIFKENPASLKEEAILQQEVFKEIAEPFIEHYEKFIDHKR